MFSLFKLGSDKMKVFKTIFLCVVLVFALAEVIVAQSVDDGAACLLEHGGVVDVVLLV